MAAGKVSVAAPRLDDYRAVAERRFASGQQAFRATQRPRVTLITVALNASRTLEHTIASIQAQTFADLEHVVVDGGSNDGTIELLRSKLRAQDYWISEPDLGISDAFNKGVALAAGDLIQFVNADDWLSPDQVAIAVRGLDTTGADFVFGDVIFYREGRPDFRYVGEPGYAKAIRRRMPALNHATALVRRDAFERIGLFDLRYRCAMDYDWFLRLHLAGGRGRYLPDLVGHMNHDGVSNLAYLRTSREVEAIAVAHGRNRHLARLEGAARMLKTSIGRQFKGPARPLYRLIRSHINRSYRPLGAGADEATAARDARR
jgi:glycosyltransferase involved in cell wall biosynthesis